MGSFGEISQAERPDGDSFKRPDFVADCRQHPADFAISPFGQDDFQPASIFGLFHEFDVGGPDFPFGDVDSFFELTQSGIRGDPVDQDVVFLFYAKTWVGQLVGELAIVGDEDQALAGLVESANVIDPFVGVDQIDHARATGRIVAGRNDARRLV